jgi:hypothetical protein
VSTQASQAEAEVDLQKMRWLMDNHEVMDRDAYDGLNRRQSIRDERLNNRDVIMRLDLDIPLTPYEPPTPEAQEQTGNMSKDATKTKKQQ